MTKQSKTNIGQCIPYSIVYLWFDFSQVHLFEGKMDDIIDKLNSIHEDGSSMKVSIIQNITEVRWYY